MSGAELEPAATAADQIAKTGNSSLDDLKVIGTWMAIANHEPKTPKGISAANALCMAYVQSMGFPISAASEVHLIHGRFVMSAKLCRALGPSHGVRVIPVEETVDSCTAAVIEISTGNELGRRTFTLAMAKRRGLSSSTWTNAPERMLWARASKMVLDDFAPWVTVGIMSAEEVGDIEPYVEEVLSGEVVDEDGVPFKDGD